jgi:RHS repeat-associated protein
VSKQVGDFYCTEPGSYREHYIRDAQGNIMATYRYKLLPVPNTTPQVYEASLKLNERPLYGSSRLGSLRTELELRSLPSFDPTNANPVQQVDLNYELTDHLGNVCAVVTGRLLDGNGGGTPKQAELVSAQGYEPFGALLPGRNYSSSSYRFGFNGKENDNEIIGTGRWQDYGERMYRTDLGIFFSPDPIIVYGKKYPELSTYQFASNTPIQAIDLDGLEAFFVHGTTQGSSGHTFSSTAKGELQRIAGNSASDESFRWYSPLLNDMPLRNIAARRLVKHVVQTRSQMMKDNVITKDEHVSLIRYSHGGNVSIQAARILNKKYGIKVNLLTVSTPAYNSPFNVDSDNILFGDPEDPQGNPGINQHIQVVHEKDKVVSIAGGTKTYSNPDNTTNYVITQEEVPLSGGIESHTDLPGSKGFGEYLKNIPQMKKAPAPTKLDEK